jgi:hypothetical protein
MKSSLLQIKRLIADKGYDANPLRNKLKADGVQPVIPGRSNRKRTIRYDKRRHRKRSRIEATGAELRFLPPTPRTSPPSGTPLRSLKALPRKSRRTILRQPLAHHRHPHRHLHANRVRKLLQRLRL